MTNLNPSTSDFSIPMLASPGMGFQAGDGHQYRPDATGRFLARAADIPVLIESGATRVGAAGTTVQRPTHQLYIGLQYFDGDLGKPVFWNGTAWVDATGAAA